MTLLDAEQYDGNTQKQRCVGVSQVIRPDLDNLGSNLRNQNSTDMPNSSILIGLQPMAIGKVCQFHRTAQLSSISMLMTAEFNWLILG
jgi:hypothetical protein